MRGDIVTIGDLGCPTQLAAMSDAFDPRASSALADTLDPAGVWRRLHLRDAYDNQNEVALVSPNPYALILDDAAGVAIEGMPRQNASRMPHRSNYWRQRSPFMAAAGIGELSANDDPGNPPAEVGPASGGGGNYESSAVVSWVQSALTILSKRLGNPGMDPRGVDGIAGTNTDNAVAAFQGYARITVDGIIGPQTIGALQAQFQNIIPPTVAGVPTKYIAMAAGAVALVGIAAYAMKRRRR